MCGIAGWMVPRNAKYRPATAVIQHWLKQQEPRGRDASGYATITDNEHKLFYMKGAVKASEFIKEFEDTTVPVGHVGLMHARSWTVGDPKHNFNNHPIIVGKTAITHNGGLANDEEVYDELDINPIEEVDSAVIAHVIDKLGYKAGLKMLEEKTPGAAAIAAILNDGNLLLARSGRPLHIGRLPERGIMWSSEVEPCLDTDPMNITNLGFRGAGRFRPDHYVLLDKDNMQVLDSGAFVLKEPNHAGYKYSKNGVCQWGRCMKNGKTALPTGTNTFSWFCKEHKKKVLKGEKVPTYSEELVHGTK